MTATRFRSAMPTLFWSADREVVFAVIAHHREDPRRSLRELARLSGCSHPHVAKILRAYAAEPGEIEAELAGGDPRYLL